MTAPLYPKDDPASVARYKLFNRWLHSPDAAQLMQSAPGTLDNLQTLLNDALWAAYCAGYTQAVNDSEAAQRVMELLRPKG